MPHPDRGRAGRQPIPNAVFGDLAALGPFFAVASHEPGAAPAAPWRPASELAEPASGVLTGRLDAVRAALASGGNPADIDLRAAASTLHFGLVARLVSPALGSAALGTPLDLRPGGLWWQDQASGPVPLSAPDAGLSAGEEWGRWLADEVIAPVTAAAGRLVPISERILWGNAASAVNTAAMEVARQRPDLAAHGWRLAASVFARPRLRHEGPPGPGFRRSSCCLFYRLTPGPPPAICGDCVLRRLYR